MVFQKCNAEISYWNFLLMPVQPFRVYRTLSLEKALILDRGSPSEPFLQVPLKNSRQGVSF